MYYGEPTSTLKSLNFDLNRTFSGTRIYNVEDLSARQNAHMSNSMLAVKMTNVTSVI